MIQVAIVGLGSWGLCALERLVHRARTSHANVKVHVVEPGPPGGGVYDTTQPDYLVLNNPCGQLSLWASPDHDGEEPRYALGLYEWAVGRGYRWVGHDCRPDPSGRPLAPTDYLPRRLMGEYLSWFYRVLVEDSPPNVEVVHHKARAVDMLHVAGGRERLVLDTGSAVVVDRVVITSGHTFNEEPGPGSRLTRPYPVTFFADQPPAGAPVAISGMGLVAFDMVAALTQGRGGTFVPDGDRLRYRASGREPQVLLYSRSGVPYCAKSVAGVDATGDYVPMVCTPARVAELKAARGPGRIDFRADVLPLVMTEMQARYFAVAAHRHGGAAAEKEVRRRFAVGREQGDVSGVVRALGETYGAFDPVAHVFPPFSGYLCAKDYEEYVYDSVATDLDEALMGKGRSPVKAAEEVTRILRNSLRELIEFGGLTLDSYIDFQATVRPRINRLEAGPPPMRSQQLLALMDAGIAATPFGPSPQTFFREDGVAEVHSAHLDEPLVQRVSMVVRGHLDMPSLAKSASPFLNRLYRNGRLQQLRYGETPVGSVAISPDFHPFDVEGRLQRSVSVLGVVTEGVRYFTHYLPSPKSRLRAVLDAQACAEAIIS